MTIKTTFTHSSHHGLDNPATYVALDPTGMRRRLRDLPRQCEVSWQQAKNLPLPAYPASFNKIVIGGMGGSAIAGDLVSDLASLQERAPIIVVRGMRLPFLLDRSSLVILCSYSGNTEETLSLLQQALQAHANIIAVTNGGMLARQAIEFQLPLCTVENLGEPRSAVGYNLMLILGILQRLDLVATAAGDVHTTYLSLLQQVSQLEEERPTADNPAKQLALELQGKVTLIYSGGLFAALARRWKTQLNENAKTWAFFETIPELLHNSVEAYNALPNFKKQLMTLILQPQTQSMAQHYTVVSKLLREYGTPCRVLHGKQGTPLEQLLGMLLMGDYVSYYLAMLNGVDPAPIPNIGLAKQYLTAISRKDSAIDGAENRAWRLNGHHHR